MGFIPGFGYVIASQLCGVDVSFSAIRFGWGVYWSQILVGRDSGIETVTDLEGLRWARPDATSTSGSLVPSVLLADAGVTPSEIVDAGGHTAAALAVYRGDADFATTFFSPPLLPEGRWAVGDAPDIPDEFIESCARNEEGRVFCGPDDAYRVLDARASAAEDAPDIMQQIKILTISSAIPNDTLSFGPDFPADLRTQIEDALVAFAGECDTDENCLWDQSIGHQDFYNWTGLAPAADADFDDMRKVVELAGIELGDL
jgi:phosphonate transport system substrate-binding protein